jgi:hypothetical protein
MVGSFCREIDNNGKFVSFWERPKSDQSIKKAVFKFNPFVHSSIMIQRQVMIDAGMYNTKCKYAQDYDLWLRLVKKYKCANIDEPLIDFRVDWTKLEKKNKEARKYKLDILSKHIQQGAYPFWYYIYLIRPWMIFILPTKINMLLKKAQRFLRIYMY